MEKTPKHLPIEGLQGTIIINSAATLWETSRQPLETITYGNNFVDNFENNIEDNFLDNIEDNSGNINTLLTPFTAMCFVQITLGPYV